MKRALLLLLAVVAWAVAAGSSPRIVSLSPNMTEILYGVGAFPQVVGVSDYCSYPPAALKLPRVGGWQSPQLERILALQPGLVVLDAAQAPFIEDKLVALGLHVLAAPDHSVKDIFAAITLLGHATGHDREAAQLAKTTRAGLDSIARRTAGLRKPAIVLIVDRTPGTLHDLYTATAGGFLSELVEIAGGRIATPPASNGYGKLSKEDLLAINPEIILDFVHGAKGRFAANPLEAWQEMPQLKAVQSGRIREVDEDYVPHGSQRIVQTAELFARLIHPEAH